jgi:hypothetical protein
VVVRISGFSGLSFATSTWRTAGAQKTGLNTQRAQLADRHVAVNAFKRDFQVHIDNLEELRGGKSRASKAEAVGQADLSADPAYSTLGSTEEMNTTATFYEPHHPDWDGNSSDAPIEVTGTYDGRYGDTQLEFRVNRDRTVGSNRAIKLNIYDMATGKKVDSVRWGANQTGQKTTKSGVVVDLGAAGSFVKKNESFFVDVYDTVGTDIDTDETFDTLEAELESAITDGSFELNGTTIDVYDDDTLDDVVDRINAAGLGVSASTANDLFTLTYDTYGEFDISVGNDTSGFLDAVKLSSSVVDLGRPDDVWTTPVGDVDAFAAVVNGTFEINGETFSVDTASDSLQDILGEINGSDADVTASLDLDTGTLVVRSNTSGGIVDLSDNTGLFDAFDINNDRYVGKEGGGLPQKSRDEVEKVLEAMVSDLNDLLASHAIGGLTELQSSMAPHFDGDMETDWGLDFDLAGLSKLDSGDLDQALKKRPEEVFDFLLGEERGSKKVQTGLMDSMLAALGTIEENLGASHGYTGLIFDRAA